MNLVGVAALVVPLDDVPVLVIARFVPAGVLPAAGVVIRRDAAVFVLVVRGVVDAAAVFAVKLGVIRVELLGVFGRVVVLGWTC